MNRIVIACLMLVLPLAAFTQFGTTDEEPDVREMSTKERIFVGGFIGLQFGTFTAVSVNTLAGYRITNRLSAGIGGTYMYANDRYWEQSMTSHTYGGSLFARFRVIEKAFIHAENEWLSVVSRADHLDDGRRRISETNFLLGPGYGFSLSPRARLNILLLYNFNENSQVYFDNPFFRVGLDISL
jgi:hypothetical protein